MTEKKLKATASQTIGPYFRIGSTWMHPTDLVRPSDPDRIVLRGRVLDGAGEPVTDALVEIWQADRRGHFAPDAEEGFRGFGRTPTDAAGVFSFTTVKPGPVDTGGGREAPHIDVSVFARGLLQRVVTRIYFPDEAAANDGDPVFQALPADRRQALVAASEPDGAFRFDIHLQGPRETPFFTF